jgi:DNA-binding transcriptional LysR family regulator
MDDKEKNAEVAKAIKLPDLASYMQVVIKQLETLRNMVAAGGGITLIPKLAVPNERVRDGVCYLPCHDPEPKRTVGLIYRPGSPLKARYQRLALLCQQQLKAHSLL